MKPTNEDIIDVLKSYDEYVCAQADYECTSGDFQVTQRVDLPSQSCELVHVKYKEEEISECHPSETSVLVYNDGTIFVTFDWDFYPEDINSIGDYEWICANTAQTAILLDGLPRVFM